MKQRQHLPWILFIVVILISTASCKKTETVPDFPELLGTWSGNTSQDGPISFYVDNINGVLFITSYKVKVYTTSGYQEYQYIKSDGITQVSNKTFRISLGTGTSGPAYLDGTFNTSDMTLSGNFAVYPAGNTVDIITGTYLADKP
jgi:hypothetical protein